MRDRLFVWTLLFFSVVACSEPTLEVEARRVDGNVSFSWSTLDFNGLLGIRVWDARSSELLWSVRLDYYAGSEVRYGEVPIDFETRNGSRRSARQEVPPPGSRPPLLRPGGSYVLAVTGQYDHLGAPSLREYFFRFDVDADGEIAELRPVEAGPPG